LGISVAGGLVTDGGGITPAESIGLADTIVISGLPLGLSFGDPLLGKSSLLGFLMELAASTGASPRSTLDGIGGGPEDGGLLTDTGG